jgi:hypothetical protein
MLFDRLHLRLSFHSHRHHHHLRVLFQLYLRLYRHRLYRLNRQKH